jgi:glycosyltransferase involved in cell wall biosynthesis
MNKDTYLVVPVYNEAGVVRKVVLDALKSFSNVVCVDDGSTDGSRAELENTKARLVAHPVNLGQGAAIQTGLEYALLDPDAKYFITFDSDGQHRLSDALAMLAEARKGEYDVILGSRFLSQQESLPAAKRVLLTLATRFSNAISGTRLTDTHNGLRVLSRRFTEKLEITMPDMPHATELVILVGRSGMKYKEMPVTIDYTDYSKAKGQSIWNSVNILFDVILQYVLGKKP